MTGPPAFSKIGSSDSPRRMMSVTRLVSGSQLTPYQLVQQSVPDHVVKMPRCGSFRAALNATSAARSEGGQQLITVTPTASSSVTVIRNKSPINLISIYVCVVYSG